MNTRFSVVIPVYNREDFARQAIDSVLSQTFTDYELIVVDDGSTDGTTEALKSYGNRIQLIQQQNRGPEVARNTGVAAARGEYIAFLDSDDWFFPTALETYDRVVRAFDSPPLVFGSQAIYREGDPIPVQSPETGRVEVIKFQDYLAKTTNLAFICSTLLVQKSLYDKIGGFRDGDSTSYYGEEFDFLLKLGTDGPCVNIRKPYTVTYRLHETNSIWNMKAHADGMLRLADAEWKGAYPGGWKRAWDRYAVIGGVSTTYAVKYCWRLGPRILAVKLLWGTAPMVFAAVVKRSLRALRKAAHPILIAES